MLTISGFGAVLAPASGTAPSPTKISPFMLSPTAPVVAQPSTITCPFGFTANPAQGNCVSDGCVTGRSQCVVSDKYKQLCSGDQFLEYWHTSGNQACGPDPRIAAAAALAAAQAAAAQAQAAADAAAAAAAQAAAQQAPAVDQAAADAEAQQQQAFADAVATSAQAAADALAVAHGQASQGTEPSPGMTTTTIPSSTDVYPPGYYQAPLLTKKTLLIGAGVIGAGLLVVLLTRR